MGTRTWSNSDVEFLRENYGKLSYAEIGAALGKSAAQVKSQAGNLSITVSRLWSEEEVARLMRDYETRPAHEIAKAIGRGVAAVHGMARKLGLAKAPDWHTLPQSGVGNLAHGLTSRFERGLEPWNKGTKTGPSHPNSKRTQFQPRNRPHNTVAVGTEVVSTDGYRKIKVAEPNVWEFVHRREWERQNGPIPKGMMVRFRDGDRMNCKIENLMLETKAEHALRNSKWKFPEEVVPAMAALADLKREIKNAKEKQDGRSA